MPAESVAFAFNGTDEIVATITAAVPTETYSLSSNFAPFTPDTDVAVGTTLVLTLTSLVGAAGDPYDVYVTNDDAGHYVGATVFAVGDTAEFQGTGVWAYDGALEVELTFDSVLGVDYILETIDYTNGGSSTTATGTGAPLVMTLTLALTPTGDYFLGHLFTDVDFFVPDSRLFVASAASAGFPGNPGGGDAVGDAFGRVNIAFDAGPLAPDPVWTQIDDEDRPNLVAHIEITAGKQDEFDKTETNRATVRLNDRDGIFDPNNAASPYFGKLHGKQILLSLYDPVANEWQSRFRGIIDQYGYDLNPATNAGVSILSNVTIDCVGIFDYLAGFEMIPGLHGDYLAVAGDAPPGSESQVFFEDGEVDTRQITILTQAGLDPARYVVFSGNVNVQETLYEAGDSALVALRDAADGETPVALANIYEDRFGRYVFHGRQSRIDPAAVISGGPVAADVWDFNTWKIGDGAAIAGDATYAQIRPPLQYRVARNRIINAALCYPFYTRDAERAAIPTLIYTDPTSIAAYGVHPVTYTDLITDGHKTNGDDKDDECLRHSEYLVENFKDPRIRVEALTLLAIHPDDPRAAATWAVLARSDISDLVQLKVGYPGGEGVDDEYFVEGFTQTIRPLNPSHDMVELTLNVSPRTNHNPYDDG